MPDLNSFRDLNGEGGANSSTARRSHLFPPCNICPSTELATTFANAVDALANGADVVSAAFLLLVEFQGHCQLDGSVDLILLLLRKGHLPQNELLGVVDWKRLRGVAESSASRLADIAAQLVSCGHSKPDGLPCSSSVNTTAPPSDFSALDLSTCSEGFSLRPDTPSYFPDDELYDMPTGPVAQSSTIHPPSSLSSLLLTPRPDSPRLPAVQSEEPGVRPSEHQQSVSQTSHAGVIVDSAVPAKRRCHDCGVENTNQ
ncbi:hypothetical protein C8R45DRAFT_183787 [Mycena sanguinolenta]|nr:hypothetical protein C8R45DRAFT_183787 [Mycena sanguinolenta]